MGEGEIANLMLRCIYGHANVALESVHEFLSEALIFTPLGHPGGPPRPARFRRVEIRDYSTKRTASVGVPTTQFTIL